MIIEFSVKNFRSIKDLQVLSLIAAPIKSKYPDLDSDNTIRVTDKLSLLRTIAIYGANGSGKSNIVKAFIAMLIFIRDSFKDDKIGEQIIEPFELNTETIGAPTFFQLIFICQGIKYRYGFEVYKNKVISEWLFGTPEKKEVYFFTREGNEIRINENQFAEGKDLTDKTSENNLFLNVCKAFNGLVSKRITEFFIRKIAISTGINDMAFRGITQFLMSDKSYKEKILSMLNMADFGVQDISNKKNSAEELPKNTSKDLLSDASTEKIEFILVKRPLFDAKGANKGDRTWIMDNQESDGTQKFFNYSGAVLNALNEGGTLVLDEFDARLHPSLTKKLVEMFQAPSVNKNGAQLIFVTHDTNLLDNTLLRRDQVYFTEKNKFSETQLYSLAEFKGIRNDASYEKDYIKGKYGAIPFLGNFEKLFE